MHIQNTQGQTLAKMAFSRPTQAMTQILAEGDIEGSLRALRAYPDALAKLRHADNASVRTKQKIEDILEEVGYKILT